MIKLLILVIILLALSCASHGPRYPNEHLKVVGNEQAQRDIEECDHLAAAYVKSDAGKTVAKSTVAGGAVGTVIGGTAGAAAGSFKSRLEIGGTAGGTAGFVRGVSKASQPGPIHKRFVEQYLRERGYDPLGWE